MAPHFELAESEIQPEQSTHVPRGAARAFGSWFMQTNHNHFADIREGLHVLTEAQLSEDIRSINEFPSAKAIWAIKEGYETMEEFLLTLLAAPSLRVKPVIGGYKLTFPYFHGDLSQADRPIANGTYVLNHKIFRKFNTAFSHEISTAGTPISGFAQLLNAPEQPGYVRRAGLLISEAQDTIADSVRQTLAVERHGNMNDYPDALVLQAVNGKINPIRISR